MNNVHPLLPSLDQVDSEGPSRDLWAAAAVSEVYRPDELLESWILTHPDASPETRNQATNAALDLYAVGNESLDMSGSTTYHLPSEHRLNVLSQVGVEGALSGLAHAYPGPSIAKSTLESLLTGSGVDTSSISKAGLMALDTVAPWAVAAGAQLTVDMEAIEARISRNDFLEALGGADLYRFVGRENALRLLHGIWAADDVEDPVLIEGPGGMGKSMVIGRFISDLVALAPDSGAPSAVFHFDFDRISLRRARLSTLLREMIRQLPRWTTAEKTDGLYELARDTSFGNSNLESISQSSRSSETVRDYNVLAVQLLELLRKSSDCPRLALFFDSVEQVDRQDADMQQVVQSTRELRYLLSNAGARVMCIYASRKFDYPPALSARCVFYLGEFETEEAHAYLMNEARRSGIALDEATIQSVLDVAGRSPLALRLAISLLEKEGAEFRPESWSGLIKSSPEIVQAALYDRILLRITDPELRKLARPGLLVRRLTVDVITSVLAGPCELPHDAVSARRLIELAEKEGQLFVRDPSDPDALRHRQDVRALMLRHMDRDGSIKRDVAKAINEAAVTFYSQRGDALIYRTEELYHRLRLAQPSDVLDQRWSEEAAEVLKPSTEEFPKESQIYFQLKTSGRDVGARRRSARRMTLGLPPEESVSDIHLFATRAFQTGGDIEDLLKRLRAVGMDRIEGPLADVYAEILSRQGRHQELLDGARQIASESVTVSANIAVSVLSIAAALLEGNGDLVEAEHFWRAAHMRSLTMEAAPSQLAVYIGAVRVLRKLNRLTSERDEILEKAIALVPRARQEVFSQRVLARESAAELSEVLLPGSLYSDEQQRAVRELMYFVLEANEAFPSAIADVRRLGQIGQAFGVVGISSQRYLHDLASKSVYGDEYTLQILIRVMREEVDWTLARAANR